MLSKEYNSEALKLLSWMTLIVGTGKLLFVQALDCRTESLSAGKHPTDTCAQTRELRDVPRPVVRFPSVCVWGQPLTHQATPHASPVYEGMRGTKPSPEGPR